MAFSVARPAMDGHAKPRTRRGARRMALAALGALADLGLASEAGRPGRVVASALVAKAGARTMFAPAGATDELQKRAERRPPASK